MLTKQQILDEVKRTAEENEGAVLGVARFEKETGISPYEWGQHWARFGDLVTEAGLTPNTLQAAYSDDFLAEKAVGLIRKLGKFPTSGEIQVEKNNVADFPDRTVFWRRWSTKQGIAKAVIDFCESKGGLEDVIALCVPVANQQRKQQSTGEVNQNVQVGEVYLVKSGHHYKIGMTNNPVRRGNEIRIQLPERMDLIHSIKTDDPVGIERYWHKRFEPKRMQGEWFDLNSADVRAFKRWKRIV